MKHVSLHISLLILLYISSCGSDEKIASPHAGIEKDTVSVLIECTDLGIHEWSREALQRDCICRFKIECSGPNKSADAYGVTSHSVDTLEAPVDIEVGIDRIWLDSDRRKTLGWLCLMHDCCDPSCDEQEIVNMYFMSYWVHAKIYINGELKKESYLLERGPTYSVHYTYR